MKSSYISLSYSETAEIIKKLKIINLNFSFSHIKRELHYKKSTSEFEFTIKLPLLLHISNPNFEENTISTDKFGQIPNYTVLLIRAGHSALGVIKDNEIIQHKVITKYMVRKKQGKSQLTYLTTKGKARGGAKLRLERTQEFFQEIRKKIFEWSDFVDISEIIFYQCTPRLWTGLFKVKSKYPLFTQVDPRLYKIPITTYKPNYKELLRVNHIISKGNIKIKSKDKLNSIKDIASLLDSLQG